MSQIARGAWQRLNVLLKERPVATNAITSGCIVAFGDFLAQKSEQARQRAADAAGETADEETLKRRAARPIANYRSDTYDVRRGLVFASFTLLVTPAWIQIYKVGDRYIGGSKSIARAIGQGFFTWCVATASNPFFIFYVTAGTSVAIHGLRTWDAVWQTYVERMQRNFMTHVTASLAFWGSQWVLLFYYLPPHLRILYASSLQIVWNGVVSYIQHRD